MVSYVPEAQGVQDWQYGLEVPPQVPVRNEPAGHEARHDSHVGGARDTRMRMLHAVTPKPLAVLDRHPPAGHGVAHGAPVPAAYALPEATTTQDVPNEPWLMAVMDAASSAATTQPDGRASTPLWQPSPAANTPVPSSAAYVLLSTTVVDGYVAVTLPGQDPDR